MGNSDWEPIGRYDVFRPKPKKDSDIGPIILIIIVAIALSKGCEAATLLF